MGKLLKKVDLVKKARKIEVTEIFPTAILQNFQFSTVLKTEKWKDAKNARDRNENTRTRS